MSRYLKNALGPSRVDERVDARQVRNTDGGGFVFEVSVFDRLERWLILGSEGGSFYEKEQKLTKDNVMALRAALAEDYVRTLTLVQEISVERLAPKNDPAIFALALASVDARESCRKFAYMLIPDVCRIGTHVFQFVTFRQLLGGGWGRGVRMALTRWFTQRGDQGLAMMVAKYASRRAVQGEQAWSMRDLLRICHVRPVSPQQELIFKWVTQVNEEKQEKRAAADRRAVQSIAREPKASIFFYEGSTHQAVTLQPFLVACDAIRTATAKQAVKLITDHKLPREVVPTELLKHPEVWKAMLPHMGMDALLRNLGKMGSLNMLDVGSSALRFILKERMMSEAWIRASKVHPMAVLIASLIYSQGHGEKGSLSWKPNANLVSVFGTTMGFAFKNVDPSGKRTMLALDVSGSMTTSGLMGIKGLTPAVATAALSLVTLHTETPGDVLTFGFGTTFEELQFGHMTNLSEAIKYIYGRNFGGTNIGLPIEYALKHKLKIDTFVIYTDCEVNSGRQVHELLSQYRRVTGIPARLIVVAMTVTNFTVGDPSDVGTLTIPGFSAATPRVISAFSAMGSKKVPRSLDKGEEIE